MSTEPTITPFKILLADDDTDDRSFFEKALKQIPISTHLTSVHDGEQLMNYFSKNPENLPDILFLDLSMPRKTGFECLAEIKENDKLKNIPVFVFTTSFGHGIDFEQSLMNSVSKLGALEYIRKPGNIDQLKKVIHQSLLKVIERKAVID